MSKFDDAVTSLMLTHPFFSSLLLKFEHVADDTVGTAAIGLKKLIYSPAFFEKLSDNSATFVVAHEVMHAVHGHVPQLMQYQKSGVGPDGKPFNQRKMNMAMDYANNAALVADGFVFDNREVSICLDSKYTQHMLPDEIYALLPDDKPDGGGGGGGSGSGGLDQHGVEGDVEGESAIDASDIIAAAHHHKQVMGKLPGGMDRLLDSLRRPAVSPWSMLRRQISNVIGSGGTTSWRRLNRPMVVRGIYMPTRTGRNAGRVGVVMDTSGSISKEVLEKFAGHVAAIIDDAMPTEVCLYWVDSKVAGTGRVKTGAQLRSFIAKGAKGGGGTNMPKGVEAAEADKCNIIVVLTDGYTPFGNPSATPVVWAITTSVRAPHGTTIKIT